MFASEFWFLFAFVLISAELFLGGTIVLFFSSLAALTIGFLITFAFLDAVDKIHQVLYFFLLTSVYSALLWKPVKKIIKSSQTGSYSNIVGRECKVIGKAIKKGHMGKVEWSGSTFNAQITEDSIHDKFEVGEVLKIIAIVENTLHVNKGE